MGTLATLKDTTDPVVLKMKKFKAETGKEMDASANYQYRCSICESYVGDKTKHCG